eukprot:jgi/Ulvmu1/7071/UM033_0132.1
MRNAPQLSIGTVSRNMVRVETNHGKSLHVPVHGGASKCQPPGPGQYTCTNGFGKQRLSTHPNPPEHSIGTAQRFQKSRHSESRTPGPGQHDVPRVKLCKLSTKAADMPQIGFARSDRRHPAYIQGAENGHLKGRMCAEIGYRVYSSLDKQPWSTFGGSASVGFAKSRRRNGATDSPNWIATPGPGEYVPRTSWKKGVKFPKMQRPTTSPLPTVDELPSWVTVGPQYDVARKNCCIGEQLVSTRKNPSKFSFSTASRFGSENADVTPAPGTYRT